MWCHLTRQGRTADGLLRDLEEMRQ
jgi:hypothetical protein